MQPSSSQAPTTLFSRCPTCGKARPFEGETRVRCAACGEEHPVEAELVQAARVYRLARANVPLQAQQTGHIEALIARSNKLVSRFRIAAAILTAPLLGLFLSGIDESRLWGADATRHRTLYAPAYILPLLVWLGSGAFVWARLARSRTAVQSLLWARPMADVPGGLACRMCGAPLGPSATRRGTVTCQYCHSDNMVGSEISRRAARLALVDYATHARAVFERVGTGGGAGPWAAAGVIAAPLVIFALLFGVARSAVSTLAAKHRPFDASIAYVTAQCPSEDVARVWKAGAHDRMGSCRAGSEAPVIVAFRPADLRGAKILDAHVRWGGNATLSSTRPELTVTDLYSDGFERNHAAIDGGFGLRGECFIEGISLRLPPITPPTR